MCVDEVRDIVYTGYGPPPEPPTSDVLWPPPPVGTEARIIDPDPVLLFRYSALTFNSHRIHYDQPYVANLEGYPGLLVHGPLLATLLLEHLRRDSMRVREFRFRSRAPLFCGTPFRTLAKPEDERVRLWVEGPDGSVAVRAEAVTEPPLEFG